MKRTLTAIFCLVSLCGMGQALPEVFTPPVTGFNRIRNENPYIRMDMATDNSGTNWVPNTIMTRTISPVLNKIIEDKSLAWMDTAWKEQFINRDSFITEADQTTLKADFYYYLYDYGRFSFSQKGKYIYTNDMLKRPSQILAQVANPPTSDRYVNNYKLSIQYDTAGLRTKDVYEYYNPVATTEIYYTYNAEHQVTGRFSFNDNNDSAGKGFYTYTPDHRISSFIQYSFDEDLFMWMPNSADTFEYDAAGQLIKYTRYMMISLNNGDPEFGPYSIEEYAYTGTGKLKEIITTNWNGTEWALASKNTFTYVNEKLSVGYFYTSDDGVVLHTYPSYRYTFAVPTSTQEWLANLPANAVYPNPANTALTINLAQHSGTVTLMDSKGAVVYSGTVIKEGIINTADLGNGLYLLRLNSGTQQTTRKIFVQH